MRAAENFASRSDMSHSNISHSDIQTPRMICPETTPVSLILRRSPVPLMRDPTAPPPTPAPTTPSWPGSCVLGTVVGRCAWESAIIKAHHQQLVSDSSAAQQILAGQVQTIPLSFAFSCGPRPCFACPRHPVRLFRGALFETDRELVRD